MGYSPVSERRNSSSESFSESSQNLMRALYGYGEAAGRYFATR